MNLHRFRTTPAFLQIAVTLVVICSPGVGASFADTSSTTTTDTGPHLRYRVAVADGRWDEIKTDRWTVPPVVADSIQSDFTEKLRDSGYFVVAEQPADSSHDYAGATNEPPANVDYIVTPSAVGYTETNPSKKGLNIADTRLGGEFGTATITINMRISDARTGDLLDTFTAIGKAHIKSSDQQKSLKGNNFTDQDFAVSPAGIAVDQALDDAVGQASDQISKEPWTALVAAQDGTTGRVVINAGDLAGVTVGDVFDVYKPGAPVTDPVSGAVISEGDETIAGRIRVVRTERYASYCDVVNGTTFDVKDIVKPAE
jgi:curli biogenesis system outer membrane secretion channel CsgG